MTDVLDAPTSPLGKPIKRTEDPRFITGEGRYLDDIKLPSMAHMAILRSPYAHANIRSIDTSAAAAMPGVIACLRRRGHPVQPAADGLAGRRQRRASRTTSTRPRVLATDSVKWTGEGVAAVVAETEAQAYRRARGDRGRLGAAAGRRRRREGDRSPARRSSTRTPRTTSSSSGPSATRTARTRPSTAPRSSSASASSTSGSSRTRWRSAATSAGTTRAPTSTRSGCPARRRTSSGCCWPPS